MTQSRINLYKILLSTKHCFVFFIFRNWFWSFLEFFNMISLTFAFVQITQEFIRSRNTFLLRFVSCTLEDINSDTHENSKTHILYKRLHFQKNPVSVYKWLTHTVSSISFILQSRWQACSCEPRERTWTCWTSWVKPFFFNFISVTWSCFESFTMTKFASV